MNVSIMVKMLHVSDEDWKHLTFFWRKKLSFKRVDC